MDATTSPSPPVPQFYCHGCHANISPNTNGTELVCPACGSEFIEEVEPSDPPAQLEASNTNPPPLAQPLPQVFPLPPPNISFAPPQAMHTIMSQLFQRMMPPVQGAGGGIGTNQPVVFQQNINFPPMPFLDLVTMLQGNGSNIFGFNMGGQMVGNPGDYFVGGNIEHLLNQMFQNAQHRGAPPASKSAIDQLRRGTIAEPSGECAICKEEFETGVNFVEMPCSHIFHPDCLFPWLEIHNSCPVCRSELKTDDQDYEARKAQSQQPPTNT